MKAFITGITGFTGSHLADFLLSIKDMDVFGLCRPASSRINVEHIKNQITLTEGNLIDYNSIVAAILNIKPDYVFHLASNVNVQYSFNNPLTCIMDNVVGTTHLLDAIKFVMSLDSSYSPAILLVSSSEVYGKVHADECPITENNPLRPLSPYAVSKVYEDLLGYQYWASWGLKVIRSRAFSHTGTRRSSLFAVSGFCKQIVEIEAQLRPPIIKVGNLESVRTFADVKDIVRAYWLLISAGEYGDVYNICGNFTFTMRELLNIIIENSGLSDIEIVVDDTLLRPSDVTLQIPNCDKFKKLTGWEPLVDFRHETLIDILNYWRSQIRSNGHLCVN